MKITGLNHITINVKDLNISKNFYGKILELKENGYIDMGDHTLTYFMLPQGVRLELIDYKHMEQSQERKATEAGTFRHFCVEVDDLRGYAEKCRSEHIMISKEPGWVEQLACSTMLIIDPNGVEIELIEK